MLQTRTAIYTSGHAIIDNMAHHQSRMTANKSRGIQTPCLFSALRIAGPFAT